MMVEQTYIRRQIEPTVQRAATQFPAVVVTGPRQAGKTTLLQHMFGSSHRYVTLDDPTIRQLARNDPQLLLREYPAPVFIDEIQYAPHLFSYIKMAIDSRRSEKGLYILTGSQHFPLMQGVSESLAGRAAVLVLLTMSWMERLRRTSYSARRRPKKSESTTESECLSAEILMDGTIRGGFPELIADSGIDHTLWYSSYIQTYLERDVRSLRQIGDLGRFQDFLQAIAARNAQLLNTSDLSRDLSITANTVRAWMTVLEGSHQVFVLRPFYRNLEKRLVKSPKLFFLDTGLLCHLIGLRDRVHALKGPAAGSLFETATLAEIIRSSTNRGEVPRVFFWRTAAGHEVDFVLERDGNLIPVEAKLTATPHPAMAKSIDEFCQLFPAEAKEGILVCLAPRRTRLTATCVAVPFAEFPPLIAR